MNVLFVSNTQNSHMPFRDESTRYRCYHMAEGLHAAGVLTDVTTLDSLSIANLTRYDVISFHQPTASRKLLKVLQQCEKLNIRTVADVDALEFDPTMAKQSLKTRLKENSLATVRADFMRQSLALQHFDEISVATEELARARRAIAPNQRVYTVPNALSNYWLSCNSHINPSVAGRAQRMGYLSDHVGMSINFVAAAKSVSAFLHSTKNSELLVVGPILIPAGQIPESQVVHGAWVDFMNLPERLASCWVNLSPHRQSPISYAEPHTNFIEAAAFGVPTIASPTADLLQHDVPGLILAETEEQWRDALESLCDPHYYAKCQKALYEYSRDCCIAKHSANLLIQQWSAKHERSENETVTRLSVAS